MADQDRVTQALERAGIRADIKVEPDKYMYDGSFPIVDDSDLFL